MDAGWAGGLPILAKSGSGTGVLGYLLAFPSLLFHLFVTFKQLYTVSLYSYQNRTLLFVADLSWLFYISILILSKHNLIQVATTVIHFSELYIRPRKHREDNTLSSLFLGLAGTHTRVIWSQASESTP